MVTKPDSYICHLFSERLIHVPSIRNLPQPTVKVKGWKKALYAIVMSDKRLSNKGHEMRQRRTLHND